MQVQAIRTSFFLLWSESQIIIGMKWIALCVTDIQMWLVRQEDDAICMTASSFTKWHGFNGGAALLSKMCKKKYFWVFTLVNSHISRLKESVPAADLWWPIYLLLCGEISRHNGKKVSEHPSQAPEREKEGEEKPHNEYLEISQFFKHECQFNTVHLLIKPTGFMLRNITVWVIPHVLHIAAEFSGQLFIDRQT